MAQGHTSSRWTFLPRRAKSALFLSLLAACATPSCGDYWRETPEHRPRPRLWTPFELQTALIFNEPVATDPSLPEGLAPGELMTSQPDGTVTMNVAAAFAERQPAAYVITDVWTGFDEIWAQPWYYLVTAWNEQGPLQNRLRDAGGMPVPALVDVAPGSGFYSPFWVVMYVQVPPDSDPNRYRSVKDFLDEERPMHLGPLFTYPMRPDQVTLPKPRPTHPILGTVVTGLSEGNPGVVYEGRDFGFFQFGGNNFQMDEGRVVEEVPLFLLATRGPDGAPRKLGVPAVAGVGPLLSGRPAQLSGAVPRLNAYYRLTWAMVPATAEPFDPDVYPDAALLITANSPNPATPVDPRAYKGRVATNAFRAATATAPRAPDCFASPTFPNSCNWLDSQARVEGLLGRNALTPTAVTVAAATVPVSPSTGTGN